VARDRGRLRLRVLAALAVLLPTATLVGCSAGAADDRPVTAVDIDHVHAVSVDPEESLIYVATHSGIVRISGTGPGAIATAVPGAQFDAMGMTVAGRMYASGHPGATRPAGLESPALGLVASDDGGSTWTSLGLEGTDFHDLTVMSDGYGEARIYGLDTAGVVSASLDGGASWAPGARLEARDLLADPGSPGRLWATTAAGLVESVDDGASFALDPAAPALYLIDAGAEPGSIVGVDVDVDGVVWSREGETGPWTRGGEVSGTPEAFGFAASPSALIVAADDRGIVVSGDLGLTWTIVVGR